MNGLATQKTFVLIVRCFDHALDLSFIEWFVFFFVDPSIPILSIHLVGRKECHSDHLVWMEFPSSETRDGTVVPILCWEQEPTRRARVEDTSGAPSQDIDRRTWWDPRRNNTTRWTYMCK